MHTREDGAPGTAAETFEGVRGHYLSQIGTLPRTSDPRTRDGPLGHGAVYGLGPHLRLN
jgi:hypothetical protein